MRRQPDSFSAAPPRMDHATSGNTASSSLYLGAAPSRAQPPLPPSPFPQLSASSRSRPPSASTRTFPPSNTCPLSTIRAISVSTSRCTYRFTGRPPYSGGKQQACFPGITSPFPPTRFPVFLAQPRNRRALGRCRRAFRRKKEWPGCKFKNRLIAMLSYSQDCTIFLFVSTKIGIFFIKGP